MTNTTGAFQEWADDIEKARANLGIQGMSTIANIASMTKAFTAAAVGELVAENKAKWDAPVSEYLSEFKLKDPRLTAEINLSTCSLTEQ
ncbi:hypothetical protein BG003_003503 [Podila horticola]|nr:hypothetical protein BG003_003503 [Podila horticola]